MQRGITTYAPACVDNEIYCAAMPTVIFRYLTRDGFAIVADGKSHKLGTDEPDKANVQKIFQIQEQSAAYALVGTVRFDDDTGKLCSLNRKRQANHILGRGEFVC